MMNLDRLDAYLSSGESHEESMMLSDLEGFLHGAACYPVFIPAQEWMSVALGGDAEEIPEWVLEAIGSRCVAVGEGLMSDPPQV